MDAAQAVIDYADVAVSAYETESALAEKRQERSATAKSGKCAGIPRSCRQGHQRIGDERARSAVEEPEEQDRYVSCQQDLVKQQSDVADAQAKIRER